jgi:hypothetical protein
MRTTWILLLLASSAAGQTAEELVAKNIEAKGGMQKIKAINSVHMDGRYEQQGIVARLVVDQKAPDFIRNQVSLQGMTQIQAYDGKEGWQISPFQGRRDPELLGEDDLRDLAESADFYGPLVDYQQKGNRVEYLGKDSVDGDDAYRLKVTLKNGDIIYYLLDPDTYLEIRTEKQEFIRGSIRESITRYGAYKLVNGVYYPFTMEQGAKRDPNPAKITFARIVANGAVPTAEFAMPVAPAVASPQKHGEPPKQNAPDMQPPSPPKN